MPDTAKNLLLEDVGQPGTQERLVKQITTQATVAGTGNAGSVGDVVLGGATPTLVHDVVAQDNLHQLYATANISTTAEPAYGVG